MEKNQVWFWFEEKKRSCWLPGNVICEMKRGKDKGKLKIRRLNKNYSIPRNLIRSTVEALGSSYKLASSKSKGGEQNKNM